MNYQLLGKSGLRVSELYLGTMTFGEEWGWGANRDESRAIFDAFAAAGGNFLDTADGYTMGTSEKMVGEFIHGQRDQFVVATKFSFNQRRGDPNAGGNHRKNMAQALQTKGYPRQFVHAQQAGHVDRPVRVMTLASGLEWLWKDCKPAAKLDPPERH